MGLIDAQRTPKRLKRLHNSNVVTLGGKTISLEGYLDSPLKPTKASPLAAKPVPIADGPNEKGAEADRSKERRAPNSKMNENLEPRKRRELPIWQHRSDIQAALRDNASNALVIVGETGSGKSTQLPQFLYRESWCRRIKTRLPDSQDELHVGGVIAITQPRRVAATSLAYRVSQEVGTPLEKRTKDGLVGYAVRFDHRVPRGTKIKFLTEGTLLQELLRDPYLRNYSAIVVDEVHERSLNVDILMGFLKQILTGDLRGRGLVPLKIVVMSATADVRVFQDFLSDKSNTDAGSLVRVLQIRGRQFPVEMIHEPQPVADVEDALQRRIFKLHMEEPLPGDILAFLTGQEEIESAEKLIDEFAATLASDVPRIKVCPLYGQLSMEGQREAFLPAETSFTRKVILATNIAETSVTVPGVRYVIDCGKAKIKKYRPRLGMESLLPKAISKSSALQRAGRAGREGPGKCYRLYTESTFQSFQAAELPEILRNDVLGAVLTMKAHGIGDITAFPLLDAPATESTERALLQLHFLGALSDDGVITPAGAQMARFPMTAPFSAVLLAAARPAFDCVDEVIDIISCIASGDDVFLQLQSEDAQEQAGQLRKELQRREGDLLTYLTTMQRYTAEKTDRAEWCKKRLINLRNMRQALNIRRQLRSLCLKEGLMSNPPPPDPQPFSPANPDRADVILRCFVRGFATKTAMLAPDGSYVTIQGKHVVAIHPASVLHGQKREAIMFLEHVFTNKSYAKKVSALRAAWVIEALEGRY
ncbi:ATP-dependent RNA helicase (Hrh1) [Ophiocordyceps camponoti-floridani]|uniref:RNA helicase n=1 Tax=Ophiocordyceps camponoti-floridani TaxID=2030778 RepID=A0A8H4QBJ5_9HYPO|nr:ATP-dependent RNA helicase (Hrh1) [Ophiocordyceps camponoti-floridani]